MILDVVGEMPLDTALTDMFTSRVHVRSFRLPGGCEHPILRREEEFKLGRRCAAAVLEACGVRTKTLARLPCGAPDWPVGIKGAITHDAGWVAVAATSDLAIGGVGIDIQHIPQAQSDLASVILSPDETRVLGGVGSLALQCALGLSAKESAFKATSTHGQPFRPDLYRIRALASDALEIQYDRGTTLRVRFAIQKRVVVSAAEDLA